MFVLTKPVRRHAGPLQAARKLVREHQIEQLGLVVRGDLAVAPRALKVVQIESCHGLAPRRDGHDPGRGARLERGEEEVGDQKRRQVIGREHGFDAVDCFRPSRQAHSNVVDEQVQLLMVALELADC